MIVAAYIHHIIKYHESCPFGLLFISDADLTYATITPEQVIQVFTGDLVIEVFDEQDTIGTRW